MNPNSANKIWFFVEGDSEAYLISNLIRNKFYETFEEEKDLSEFVKNNDIYSTSKKIYCENCGSVDKIPHRINEIYYLIQRSKASHIIVICDIEKLKCYSSRKNHIECRLENSIDKTTIKYVFFNPMIEDLYWKYPEISKKIIEMEYRNKFKPGNVPQILLPNRTTYVQDDLKKWFKKYDLKYRETAFAKEFFPRIDYVNLSDAVLTRLCQFLESIR